MTTNPPTGNSVKNLTEKSLLKEGWIKAIRKSGKIDWLWNECGEIYSLTFDEAKQVMKKAYPGMYV